MLRRFVLLSVALSLFAATVTAQEGRQRRVRQQPAAAVRGPNVSTAAAPLAFAALPFAAGETLAYDVTWNNNATAATMVLSVGKPGSYFGEQGLPLSADIETIGLVRLMFAMNIDYKSYSDPKTMLPFRADQDSTINGKTTRSTMLFDRSKNVVVAGGAPTPVGAETGDPLSLFYRLRAMPLKVGDSVTLDGFDGKRRIQLKATVEAREQIRTASGQQSALRVAFLPIKDGATTDQDRIRIWYTDDTARVPVLVTAEPEFGAIRMELRSATTARL